MMKFPASSKVFDTPFKINISPKSKSITVFPFDSRIRLEMSSAKLVKLNAETSISPYSDSDGLDALWFVGEQGPGVTGFFDDVFIVFKDGLSRDPRRSPPPLAALHHRFDLKHFGHVVLEHILDAIFKVAVELGQPAHEPRKCRNTVPFLKPL